ncbi:MAG: recombinase RecA, partial [Deltaproteobacteria bacterium]|nr:recombinase RecA [Deltaproteobacteria bacterium]
DRIGQGRDNAVRFLKENSKILARLEKAVLEKNGIVLRVSTTKETATESTPKPTKATRA